MKKPRNPNVDEKGDFILRWKLDRPKEKKHSDDPFRDFTRDLIRELLGIVALMHKGEEVKVDGFHFLNSSDIYKLYK